MVTLSQRISILPTLLDAALEIPPTPTEEFPAICQICMDTPASVFQLCGGECLAEVCSYCLVRHLTASIYSFYPGVLPKVRCPVCLNLLNKNQWLHFVQPKQELQNQEQEQEQEQPDQKPQEVQNVDDNSHVLDKYVTLCRQSCGFQSPCCHLPDYSMLPERYAESHDENDEDLQLDLPIDQVEAVDELYRRGVEFCYHRQDVAEFYHFLTSTFHENVEKLLWIFLPKIVDEERRAALLLRHLSKNPDTHTICCGMDVCFKCKATNHHDGDCRDFIEDENVVECRGCGVTVVMVDGCDSLNCLCGFSFSWSDEVERQRLQRKLLAPSDLSEYDDWALWHYRMKKALGKVTDLPTTKRELRLARLVREHHTLLRRVLLPPVYRRRLSKKEPESVEEATIKLKSIAETPLAPESPTLSRSTSVPILLPSLGNFFAMDQPVDLSRAPLDVVAPATLPLPTAEVPDLCQICMDAPASVFQICGTECLAEVCDQCVVQHLVVNVYSFYPGVLPKVRCPVCLSLLNKSQWQHFVSGDDDSHVLEKCKVLCRQNCGFQSPCCHPVLRYLYQRTTRRLFLKRMEGCMRNMFDRRRLRFRQHAQGELYPRTCHPHRKHWSSSSVMNHVTIFSL